MHVRLMWGVIVGEEETRSVTFKITREKDLHTFEIHVGDCVLRYLHIKVSAGVSNMTTRMGEQQELRRHYLRA